MKVFEKIKIGKEKEIQIFGFPILQYGKKDIKNGTEKYIKLFPTSFEKKLVKMIFKNITNDYDDLYLLRCGLGEAYLINFFIDAWTRKNKSKNPCYISPRSEGREWNCFYKIPVENITIPWQSLSALKKRCYKYKGRRLFVFLPLKEIRKIVRSYQKKPQPHVKSLLKFCKLTSDDLKPVQPVFSRDIKDSALARLKENKINKNNFVFISSDALSAPLLPQEFWNELKLNLEKKGIGFIQNKKEISISEALYLSSIASAVIALRSGFSEGLANQAKKIFVLYTPLKSPFLPIPDFIKAYSLVEYPFATEKQITEFDTSALSHENIIQKIIEEI